MRVKLKLVAWLQLQELIRSVLPFDALMFKSHRAVAPSSRRGLEVLEHCARLLLQELRLEGYAPGLEVEVQVGRPRASASPEFSHNLLEAIIGLFRAP